MAGNRCRANRARQEQLKGYTLLLCALSATALTLPDSLLRLYNQPVVRQVLERDAELSALADAVRSAADGRGSVVLIMGEAGIGKSSLVEALRAHLPAEGRMLVGLCDDLATPRTLGPFRDLAGSVGAELSRAVADGSDRDRVLTALRAELSWAQHPTVLVIEDIHWADEATLDALRYLIRRIPGLPAVLVLTYRDDELSREHALHGLLGQASSSDHILRLHLRRLSPGAVRELSAGSNVDAADLMALTSGNPFFVHELLAAAQGARVPRTVVDAVLGRVRHLDPPVQDVLEQLAVVPSALERWLVDILVPDGVPSRAAALAAAEQRGLLTVSTRRISFRHELTRRAIADSLPSARLIALNQRVLAALAGRGDADPAQIVHHAAQAGDAAAIVRYGPQAAREAASAGSHREAVAHYGLVLGHADMFDSGERAELLEKYAIECYTIGAADRAAQVQQGAVDLNRQRGDLVLLGASLRWLSRIHWMAGNRGVAVRAGQEAIEVLEDAGDPRLLALALSNQSQLHMLAAEAPESITLGERAVALARQVGDPAIISHALTNIGTARSLHGDVTAGIRALDEALRVALAAGDVEDACRAYVNLTWVLLDWFRLAEAERYLAASLQFAEQAEFLGFLSYMQVERARLELGRGAWDAATQSAQLSTDPSVPMPIRCAALTVLGRIAVRRGDPESERALGSARDMAEAIGELQRTGPVAAARAEQAWLRGDLAGAAEIVSPLYWQAVRLGEQGVRAELGYWLAKAGQRVEQMSEHPYAIQSAGRWREAAAVWEAAGCRYEHAAALAESPEPEHLLAAVGILDDLGARPLATVVRRRLRELGVTGIPRGPVSETRANPAGLTQRQVDVLRLLGQGHTNADIAGQLVVSVRTVDSHVAALLDKLGATSRREAAARAAELGILDGGNQ